MEVHYKKHIHNRTPDADVIQDPGVLSRLASGAFNSVMMAPFIAPLVGGAGWLLTKTGEKTGISTLAKAGRSTQGAIQTLSNKTIVELAGDRAYTKEIGAAIQKGANVAGELTDKLSDSLHLDEIGKLSGANAKKHLTKISTLLGEHKDLPRELKPHLRKINNIVKNGSNFDPKKLESAIAGLSQATKGLKKDLPPKVSKTLGTIAKLSDKATNSKINANILGDLGGAVRGLPKALGNAPVMSTVMNTGFVASSATEAYGVWKGFRQNLSALKEMQADIGNKPSAAVKEARSKAIKSFVASEISAIAGLAASVANIFKGRMSFVGFVAPQLVGGIANTLIGDSALPYYASLKQAHASGRPIPVEAYAEFITKISPELQARGHTGKVFAKKLAEQFSAEKASPADIMKEMADHKFEKRISDMIAANEAKKSAKAMEVTAINEPSTSHVAGLQNSSAKTALHKKEQVVVGPNTAKIVSNAAQAQHALNNRA